MKHVFQTAAFASLLMLASCFGQHNQAPSTGAHLDDPRVYGVKGGEPMQLPTKYPADETGEVAERVDKIKQQLFPMPAASEVPAPADTAAAEAPAPAEGTAAAAE